MNRSRAMQILWTVVALALLVVSGMFQPGLDERSRTYELNPPEVTENYPFKMLVTMAPGGLRAPLVGYLWIRADKLQQDGRYYEAMQLADLICNLQPNFAGVWGFQGWNMAYNISVQTHTPEERWRWVYGGIELIRDRGIGQNRKALQLYRELGWIWYHKMGRYMDEMHMTYKQRWAAMMQRLLAAPPYGTTEQTIAAFRPVAEALLDRDFRRQGQQEIQRDQLAILLKDPAARAYAEELAGEGIEVGWSLLDAYNRYSNDESLESVRLLPLATPSGPEQAVSDLINESLHAQSLSKLLAFTRAQLLWNIYRMDPDWMLQLMERFGPLDWRLPMVQAVYWTSYGLHVCEAAELGDITSLNTDRMVLNALKSLTWRGRLTYIENPDDANRPFLTWGSDWRFVEPTQKEFILMGQATSKARGTDFASNQLAIGHVNYLAHAMEMLYAGYHRKQAQELLDYVREAYDPPGIEWSKDLEDFVIWRLNYGGQPSQETAYSQITPALKIAFLRRIAGDMEGYRKSVSYAKRVYAAYTVDVPVRLALPPFGVMSRDVLMNLLVRPKLVAVNLSLTDRSELYKQLDDSMQRALYDLVSPGLKRQCELEQISFDKAFPQPPGMEELRLRKASRQQGM